MSRKRKRSHDVSPPEPSRTSDHRAATGRRWFGVAIVLALAVLAGGVVWWQSGRGREAGAGSPSPAAGAPVNVLLITADTLGADQLGTYGNRVIATPHLDALAASGVLFENATTVAPLTLPAHTSIMTGTYPVAHHVRDNGSRFAQENLATLAGALKQAGYATAAFVGAFVLDSRWGLDRGFDHYVDDFDLSEGDLLSPDMVRHRGEDVIANAQNWLDHIKGGPTPFFAWVHLFDPHAPYEPPEPYRSRYGNAPWGLYHAEVAHVDDLVGRLLDWLAQNHLAQSTVVVFVGDHGESLGRHGELSHGFFVYDATIQVPFILRGPGLPNGQRIAAQVSSIDLMPTVLSAVRVPVPATVQGRDLLHLTTGSATNAEFEAYSETYNPRNEYGWSELRSLRTESFHFIDAPRPELYDLKADPAEANDLAAQHGEGLGRYTRALEAFVARASRGSGAESRTASIDSRAREQLAALGYVAGAVQSDRARLSVDPKDKIHLVNLIKEAGAELKAGRIDPAFAKIKTVLSEDKDILAAYNVLGNLHLRKGDKVKALEAFQEAVKRDSTYRPALFNVAVLHESLGRPRDAAAALERLLALDPDDSDVVVRLGQAALERGDLTAAEQHYARAAELEPSSEDAHYNLGTVYHRRGDLTRAEAEYRLEISAHPRNVKAHHYLGLLHAQQNNYDGQLEEFQTVVNLNPASAQAHFLLADALFQKDRLREALTHITRAIELDAKEEQPYLLLAAIQEKLGNQAAREQALRDARARRPAQ